MAITLYFLSGFNNYYNRTIKMPDETNVSAYSDYIIKTDEVEKFNPNDGVMSSLTLNYWDPPYDIDDAYDVDYLLVSLTNPQQIDSKWFILDRRRKAEQQWELTIRRDLVSDNYDDIINAPCLIEKATLAADSPFIFNQEDFATNQIKQEETLLKDKSGCAWIVGYIAEKDDEDTTMTSLSAPFNYDKLADIEVDSLSDWNFYPYADITSIDGSDEDSNPDVITHSKEFRVMFGSVTHTYVRNTVTQDVRFDTTLSGNTSYEELYSYTSGTSLMTASHTSSQADRLFTSTSNVMKKRFNEKDAATTIQDKIKDYMANPTKFVFGNRAQVRSIDGLTLKTGDNRFYKISVSTEKKTETVEIKSGDIYNKLAEVISAVGTSYITGTPNTKSFTETVTYELYTITLTETNAASGTVNLPSNRYKTKDGTYDMFCMPYADVEIYQDGVLKFVQEKEVSLAAATGLARKYFGNGIYDLQLVPFCPVPYMLDEDGKIDISSYVVGTIQYREGTWGYVFFPNDTKFSINIPFSIPEENDATEKKIKNQCEFYRLCSPNYNGVFEFNPQKNGGVTNFNVDITYKPYSPYIHVNPDFGGLYGQDFDDARGLLCGGDFSLPITTDAWAAYELQNKNYEKTFQRQITYQEEERGVRKAQEIFSGIAGTITTGAAGVGSGLMATKNPWGAVAGGAIGTIASGVGAYIDYQTSEKLHSMSIDYSKDLFKYSNENIKALPYSLAKTTAYTNNNKIFPFVERYDATEEEKEAFREKLKYNGMSVGVIGKIANFQQETPSYIKGSIIRIENNQILDYHTLSELSNEIYKGVFI